MLKINTWTLTIQDSNSPVNDIIIFFHDFTIIILVCITSILLFILLSLLKNKYNNRFLLQNHFLELLWTIIPIIILILIAIPSIKILYFIDDLNQNTLTIKCIGNQWYWKYEYTDFFSVEFNSYIIPSDELDLNEFRLLDVDNRCIIPFNFPIRLLSTSIDVIHAWTVPPMGIKIDSTPGRLNQSLLIIHRPGLYFGQCSEICGINHRFIPIVVESTNLPTFKNWLINFYIK